MDQRKYSRLVVDGAKQTPSRAMLRAVGFQDADFAKPQIGVASTWASLTPCNMHINELATEARRRRRRGRRQGRAVQHHHRVRRHLDGLARHALLAGVARSDRRLDRDGGGCRRLRRLRRHRRLRQEHAGLRHGDRAPQSPGGVRLRRHHQARARSAATSSSVFEAVGGHAAGRVSRRGAARSRAHRDSRAGQLRRHVHRQHHGLGHRGARTVAA